MEMGNVLASFQHLCDNPLAWALVALGAMKMAHSVYLYRFCPEFSPRLLRVDPEEARALAEAAFRHSPRFLVVMLAGMGLAIGGLYLLQDAAWGGLALAAMVIGTFLLVTEPAHLAVFDNRLRVIAARVREVDAREAALDRLRASHFERIGLEAAFTSALAAILLLY